MFFRKPVNFFSSKKHVMQPNFGTRMMKASDNIKKNFGPGTADRKLGGRALRLGPSREILTIVVQKPKKTNMFFSFKLQIILFYFIYLSIFKMSTPTLLYLF